ncbi:hypothetical protein [Desulfosporosinus sp.]|uniref:hypothetical protein n=1 Tax=Desulfosporosinus sp. TaxID=157907 RepID=UPI00230BE633|nr:hypothetical protein [Desulfosporosinus sp.]MDA8223588.1 hypothetical protein [Desulfitobacterium hafniense]
MKTTVKMRMLRYHRNGIIWALSRRLRKGLHNKDIARALGRWAFRFFALIIQVIIGRLLDRLMR